MKNICFSLCLFLLSCSVVEAQERPREQEFLLSLNIVEGINNLNAYYKLARENKPARLYRFRLGQYVRNERVGTNNHSLNYRKYSLGIGAEARLKLTKKALVNIGFEPFGSVESFTSFDPSLMPIDQIKSGTAAWQMGFSIPYGVIFNGASKWFVAIETRPGAYYQKIESGDAYQNRESKVGFEIGISYLSICFGYRIPTKRI